VIGADLPEAERDRLSDLYEVSETSSHDDAIELLLQETVSKEEFSDGPDGERARRLQTRIDEIDDAGGDLLDLDAESVTPLNLAERLHLLETRVAEALLQLFGWRHFEVRLLDRESKRLELVIANGIEPLSIGHTISAEPESNGISGWVAATGRSYICRDCMIDPRYMGGLEGARSSLTTPLRLHDRVIGVLNVESDKIEQFDEEGRLLLELYGRYVAMAVNILDMLIVERYTTNRRLSNNVIAELEQPVKKIEGQAEDLRKAYVGDARMVEGLEQIIESVASMRARIRSCTAGPQTILGAEGVLHQEELEPVLEGQRVLVADDEPVIRQTICAVLEQRGCSVEVCVDGTSAIMHLESSDKAKARFDLVISDVRMPDRNGYEVFRAAKDVNPDTPVILMTGFGYDPHHSVVRSSQEGLHCFLFKPFQVEQLLEEVYKALIIERSES
jgi:CheY-like chemotaxis protein